MMPALIPRAARAGSSTMILRSAAEVRNPVSMMAAGVVGAMAWSNLIQLKP